MEHFAHLHVYTRYTNPDGVCDIRSLVKKASDLGMEALAITDKNVMFGVPEFYKACKDAGIKPIIGCEVTVGTEKDHHSLVLLCETETGYKNLVRLVSDAWLESDGVTPVVTFSALKKHSKGLIALSAGPEGEINALLLLGDREKAKAAAMRFRNIFGTENFFIELQDHGLSEDSQLLSELAELSEETGVQTVATNAGMIAERCASFDLFRWFSVPPFKTPNGEHAGRYFRELCLHGLKERMGGDIPPGYKKRLEEEILHIRKMGYADYFLLIWDVVRYAKSAGVPVGPGRGSAPGCLALYACGVTEIDPVKHGLSFERFMNPEIDMMPDIDIDVAPQYRDRLIMYLSEKLGEGRVFPVCSLRTGYPVSALDYKLAILTDETADLIPLIKTEEGAVLTQYDRKALGMCGALDVDFTPLNVLGTLDAAVKRIREKDPDFRLDAIDLADKKTFDMLRMGKSESVLSESVFTFEGETIRELLEKAFPDSMADLAALYTLDRPGTEDYISEYLKAKRHPETVTYRTPELEPILKETCGVILYQEQVMEILHTLAGYSLGRADFARRAINKKRPDVLKLQREIFVYGSNGEDSLSACDGCLKRGINEETANAVFDDIEKYCYYAICKSHAVPYALLSYQTAYLKCHYPEEWEAAITGDANDTDF